MLSRRSLWLGCMLGAAPSGWQWRRRARCRTESVERTVVIPIRPACGEGKRKRWLHVEDRFDETHTEACFEWVRGPRNRRC